MTLDLASLCGQVVDVLMTCIAKYFDIIAGKCRALGTWGWMCVGHSIFHSWSTHCMHTSPVNILMLTQALHVGQSVCVSL